MDIGVDSVPEARRIIRDLDLALQTRQIRLNSGKTKILSEVEAREHFKIRENLLLDKLSNRIEAKRSGKLSLAKERRAIELAIRGGRRRKTFSSGNGEKILKRLINLARQCRADINDDVVFEFLKDWPGLRHAVLVWWQGSARPETRLYLVTKLLAQGGLVDDSAVMDAVVAVISARLPKSTAVANELAGILGSIDHKTPWGFYSKVWLLSKYGSAEELMLLIEGAVPLWATQEHLSRLVAGLFPRFVDPTLRAKFVAIVRRAGNPWSISVLRFHFDLARGTKGYVAIKSFILANNTSLPNDISHSKFLMLLTLLGNSDLAPTAAARLTKVHSKALSDPYYSSLC